VSNYSTREKPRACRSGFHLLWKHLRISVKMSMSRATLLGTGDDGTTPCVLLEDGKRRLLINASEGLQRLSFEHALRLHRDLDAVLLSSLAPTAVAGLPGLLLLMGDAGVASVHVLGPIGTASLVRSFSAFVQPRTHILVSELTGDEVISWRGHTDIFGLPLERGAAHEAQACAAERWIAANGGCFPHRTGLLPRLADERMLPVKRRRDDAAVDEVARELIDANEEEESEDDSSDEDGTSSDASNDTSSSSAGAAAAPPANTSAAVDEVDEAALFEQMVGSSTLSAPCLACKCPPRRPALFPTGAPRLQSSAGGACNLPSGSVASGEGECADDGTTGTTVNGLQLGTWYASDGWSTDGVLMEY
jgi:hypothetical protein